MSLEKRAFYCLVRGVLVGVLVGLVLYFATLPTPKGAGVWTSESWAIYCEEHYNK